MTPFPPHGDERNGTSTSHTSAKPSIPSSIPVPIGPAADSRISTWPRRGIERRAPPISASSASERDEREEQLVRAAARQVARGRRASSPTRAAASGPRGPRTARARAPRAPRRPPRPRRRARPRPDAARARRRERRARQPAQPPGRRCGSAGRSVPRQPPVSARHGPGRSVGPGRSPPARAPPAGSMSAIAAARSDHRRSAFRRSGRERLLAGSRRIAAQRARVGIGIGQQQQVAGRRRLVAQRDRAGACAGPRHPPEGERRRTSRGTRQEQERGEAPGEKERGDHEDRAEPALPAVLTRGRRDQGFKRRVGAGRARETRERVGDQVSGTRRR